MHRPSRHASSALVLVALFVASSVLVVPPAHATSVPSAPHLRALSPPTASRAANVVVAPAFAPDSGVVPAGPLPANATLGVVVGLASADPGALDGLATAFSVPGSPLYRQFLSAPMASARFGASESDIAAAEAYFESFGLHTSSHRDGLLLSVSGPSGLLGRAFGTEFDLYRTSSGRTFFDHPTPAVLPSIAAWTGVYGLGDSHPMVPSIASVGPARAVPGASCGAAAEYTPCTFDKAYSFGPVLAANHSGTGERIGIVDPYAAEETQTMLANDLATFSSTFGLSAPNVSFLYPVPTSANLNASGTNAGWGLEEALDLEWAHGSAPNASLVMTFSPNPGSGLYFAIDALVSSGAVDVLSLSWGEPDVGTYNPVVNPCPSACNATTDGSYAVLGPVLELASVEGITTFAASGDCGSSDGTAGVSTNFPASEPWVTGVGGTDLNVTLSGSYVDETAWSGNSSGAVGTGCSNQGGSGGGFSPFPKPAWQHGTGTRGSTRGVPDVAIDAGHPVEEVYGGSFTIVTGTSVGTPVWAGIGALADETAGHALGLLNPSLYAVLNSVRYASAFHDIRTGSNGYAAGTGWDPVTGLGSPVVSVLLPLLTRTLPPVGTVQTFVYGAPRFGPAPLAVTFVLSARGGTAPYPIEGVIFGDGNASLTTNATVQHTYRTRGAYSASSFVVDANGTAATSPPILVDVGGGKPLHVGLTASSTSPAVGAPVRFNVTVTGGTPPYLTNLSFGDGSGATNLSVLSVLHSFIAAGGYCAEATVRDAAHPENGGASARVAVAVGGAGAPACSNPASPLAIAPIAGLGVRDAPADFPALFVTTGGSTAPLGLQPNISLVSNDPYVPDCACTIFRAAGNYSVQTWENDTVNGEANASTNVTVAPPLNATFRVSTLAGPVPLIVNFTASVTGGYLANASTTRWTFGTGPSHVGASAGVTYATPGEYVAVASLSDRGHGNASEAFLIDAEPPGPLPVGVVGTVFPAENVSSGTNVTFAATLLGPPTSLATATASWNLGNGDAAFGPDVTETYFAPVDTLANNTLAAGVTVYGPHLHRLFTMPITLPSFFAVETGGFHPAVSALALDAAVEPGMGVTSLAVWGNATAAGPGGANVSWLFGDGGSAAGLNVTHVYYGAGDFTVVATAYDGFHDIATRLSGVVANQALAVAGGPNTVAGDAPLTVNFSVAAVGGAGPPYSYNWTFPGGVASGVSNLSLTFEAVGHYTVSLRVADRSNASLVLTWTITVEPVPSITVWEVALAGAAAGAALAAAVWWRRRTGGEGATL